jgi:Domain of unknown function (DUF222)
MLNARRELTEIRHILIKPLVPRPSAQSKPAMLAEESSHHAKRLAGSLPPPGKSNRPGPSGRGQPQEMSEPWRRFEHVSERGVGLPEGLAELPPGPALAAALSQVGRARLSGYDMVVVLRARSRQLAYEQAEFAADLAGVAECVRAETAHISSVWDSDIPQLAAAEIAAALTWTKRAAKARLEDAWLLVGGVPQVWAALRAGVLDLPKARVLAEGTWVLSREATRRVIEQILPDAPGLTTGQLAYRLRRLVLEADPAAANKDYDRG